MGTTSRTAFAAAVLLTTLAAAAPAAAGAWTVRGAVAWVEPDLALREVDGFTRRSLDADSAVGVAVSAEYRFTERFGLELGLLWAEPEIRLQVEGIAIPLPPPVPPIPDRFVAVGDLRMTPLTAGLNVHLTPGSRADLYLGPRLAYVLFDDLELKATRLGNASVVRIETDDELGYGAEVGVDLPFGRGRWMLHAAADYLVVDLTLGSEPAESLDFDPLIVRAGLAYRF